MGCFETARNSQRLQLGEAREGAVLNALNPVVVERPEEKENQFLKASIIFLLLFIVSRNGILKLTAD